MPATSAPPGTPAPGRPPVRRVDWPGIVCAAVLASAAALAYARTFSDPLLFDDAGSITGNPSIRHLGTAFSPPPDATVSGRPVLNFSLAIDYAISGTAVWSYHASNLAIHVLAGLLLFGIIRRTLSARAALSANSIAFSGALLWALHPLQTESVSYTIQRAESLMGLFYLLTVYGFIRGSEAAAAGRRPWFVVSVAACFLGMATKEVMVSAPLIVLLYDRTFLAGTFREAWRRRWPVHAGLAATWLILAFLVLSTHGRSGTAGLGSGISPLSYALTQSTAIVHYLRLCFWPHPLIFDYGRALAPPSLWVGLCALAVAALISLTGWALLRKPALGFLGAGFFALLAPSSSILPVATEAIAEHRLYLPLAAVVVLVVIGMHRWLGRAALPSCLVLAAGLFVLTWRRNGIYRSDEGIWSDTVAQRPGNERAHNNLGFVLSRMPGRLNEAIAQYEDALRLAPDYAQAHVNLGDALVATPGRLDEGIAQYDEALRLNPGLFEVQYNLACALDSMPGRLNEAVAHYGEAVRLKPDYAEAHYNLGCDLAKMPGRLNEAIAHYQEALRLRPDYAEAHFNLGIALETLPGRMNDALAQYGEALRVRPGYAEAHYNLGCDLQAMPGRLEEAIAHYAEAIRLKPDFAEAYCNLGNALNSAGRPSEAIPQFEQAVRLRPDNAAFHLNLAIVLLNTGGRVDEAAEHLREVLRLQPGNGMVREMLDRIGAFPR